MGNEQSITLNFAESLDTKTDPWQLSFGKFAALTNSVFTTGKRLTKRNGYGLLATVPPAPTLTTFSNNLLTVGNSINLFSEDSNSLINTGLFQPLKLSALPLVRRATGQLTVDSALAPNGLSCSTWLDSDGNSYYQINDSVTGGTIIPAISLTTGTDLSATMSRVFVLGNYFVVTYLATVSASATLRYVAIPYGNPTLHIGPTTISTQVSSITAAYDGIAVATNPSTLYLAWNASDGGGAIRLTSISHSLVQGSIIANASLAADLISTTYDSTLNQFWITAFNLSGTIIKAAAYNQLLSANLLNFTTVSSSVTLNQGLTSTADNGVLHVFYEVSNTYGYDNGLRTDFISKNSLTLGGTAGTASVILRSVGLGSKATLVQSLSKSYMLVSFGSQYQPTYFLIDDHGNVIGKLAYSNGGGYAANQILPQINQSTVAGQTVFQTGYLFKDFLASIANPVGPLGSDVGTNKTMGAVNTLPVYTQTGINFATFTFGSKVSNIETGSVLHLGAGFPWVFDGVKPVEHQFHLWPDAVEVTPLVSLTPTGTVSNVTTPTVITSMSSTAGIVPGMAISGAGIPANTTVVRVGGASSVIMSAAATAAHSAETITFTGGIIPEVGSTFQTFFYQAIYYWTDGQGNPEYSAPSVPVSFTCSADDAYTFAQINIPTARLTYKTANKIRIRLYRWSTQNQEFFEVTSVSSPTLNDPTVDYITITDILPDSAIVGNSLIYTTGGVVEDIPAPSFSVSTMFDDRMWVLDSEDGTLWYSKQVIQGTGVEFSDLFTYYVADSIGTQGSTGPVKTLAPMDVELILFKKQAIYYINGVGPDNTGANSTYSQPTFITATVGCENPNSIVLTDAGLMFQSDKGIWLLGRNLQTSYIGAPVEAYNQYAVTSAYVIPDTTQVRFTLSNGVTLMYDTFYGQWAVFNNTPAVSATLYQGLHTYLNQFGEIAQETPGQYTDLGTPVLMSFTTSWLNLASLQGYQRVRDFYLLAQYLSPHLLNVQLAYDYNPTIFQSSIIKPKNFSPTIPAPYGTPTPYGGPYNKEQWRVHAKQQLCQSFQLTISEVFDSTLGAPPGAGFTMSGVTARLDIKKSARPIPGSNAVG